MKNDIRQILKNHHTRVPQNHSLLKNGLPTRFARESGAQKYD